MNLETKITIYKFTPQVFTLTRFSGQRISSRGAPQKKISHSLPHQVTRMGYTNKTNNKAICHRQPLYMIRDSIYFLFQPD